MPQKEYWGKKDYLNFFDMMLKGNDNHLAEVIYTFYVSKCYICHHTYQGEDFTKIKGKNVCYACMECNNHKYL